MNVYDKIRQLDTKASTIMRGSFEKKPQKPIRTAHESHTSFGIAMDEYEGALVNYNKIIKDRRIEVAPIFQEIEDLIRVESGLSKLPKSLADKFYNMAQEQGHSSGYQEILSYALDYSDIVDDILKIKNGEL